MVHMHATRCSMDEASLYSVDDDHTLPALSSRTGTAGNSIDCDKRALRKLNAAGLSRHSLARNRPCAQAVGGINLLSRPAPVRPSPRTVGWPLRPTLPPGLYVEDPLRPFLASHLVAERPRRETSTTARCPTARWQSSTHRATCCRQGTYFLVWLLSGCCGPLVTRVQPPRHQRTLWTLSKRFWQTGMPLPSLPTHTNRRLKTGSFNCMSHPTAC